MSEDREKLLTGDDAETQPSKPASEPASSKRDTAVEDKAQAEPEAHPS